MADDLYARSGRNPVSDGDFVLKFVRSKIGGEADAPYDAEDLAQDVWVRVLERPPDVVTKKWLRLVASSICANYLKRRGLERRIFEPILRPDETELDDGDDVGFPEPSIPSEESRILASVDLEKIPADIREILELRYVKGLSHKEIGDELGCSENAAQKKVSKALEKARRILGP